MSPTALAPLVRRPTTRRRITAVLIGLSLPLLAACSSDATSGSPATSVGTTAAGTGSPATSAATAAATPTIAANGDPFCDLAAKAQSDETELNSTMTEFDDLMPGVIAGTAPVGDLNGWGSALYELAGNSAGFFDDAGPYVAGTDAEGDFAAMSHFIRTYSMGLAAMARDATDSQAFLSQMGPFTQTPDVQAAMTAAPTAAKNVSAYILDRCPAAG